MNELKLVLLSVNARCPHESAGEWSWRSTRRAKLKAAPLCTKPRAVNTQALQMCIWTCTRACLPSRRSRARCADRQTKLSRQWPNSRPAFPRFRSDSQPARTRALQLSVLDGIDIVVTRRVTSRWLPRWRRARALLPRRARKASVTTLPVTATTSQCKRSQASV